MSLLCHLLTWSFQAQGFEYFSFNVGLQKNYFGCENVLEANI